MENFNGSSCSKESKAEEQNQIEFFKLIIPDACATFQKRLKAIENCFVLRHKFDLQIHSIDQFVSLENRLKFLDLGIENIIKRGQVTENICQFFVSEICELSTALNFSKMFGVKCLSQRMKCLLLSCALAYNVMEIADCNRENKDDYIEMALEILAQQIYITKGSHSSTLAALLNDNDALTFPLVYELLVRASLLENVNNGDLIELINYVRIASKNYSLNEIENVYGNREKNISKLIRETIEATEMSVGDSTLNFSPSMDNSFDVKSEIKPKKRYSVSLFDEVMPLTQQHHPHQQQVI